MTGEAGKKPKPLSIKTQAEREAALEQILSTLKNKEPPSPAIGSIGSLSAEGIFLGQYKPNDRDGKSLGKIFNVFAAPQDLPGTMKYIDTLKHLAKLKNWNGFDGGKYTNDEELYAALKDGTYKGEWVIPPRELLSGKDVDGNNTQPDNLYAHKDKGALKGTFCTAASIDSDCPGWYWSSTENRHISLSVLNVRFLNGVEHWDRKGFLRLSCRPVRLVAV